MRTVGHIHLGFILTKEINCGEEEEEMDGGEQRRMERRQTEKQVTAAQRAEKRRLTTHWKVGCAMRADNTQEDGINVRKRSINDKFATETKPGVTGRTETTQTGGGGGGGGWRARTTDLYFSLLH